MNESYITWIEETNSKGAIIGYKWSISSNSAHSKEIPPRVEKRLSQWKEPIKVTPQKELF